MSGVDPAAPSASSLPPVDSGADGPPPALPSDVEPADERHGIGSFALSVGAHGLTEGTAFVAEEGLIGAGGIIGLAWAGVASTLGWGLALAEMGHAVLTAPSEGGREGLIESALGGRGWPTSRTFGAGLGMVMLDMTPAEIDAAAARIPDRDGLREGFLAGVADGRAARDSDAPGWAAARDEYRDLFRAWSDGHAAAIGGWDTPDRSELFARSRREMEAYLDAHPEEAAAMRAEYRADVRDGFVAADEGRIDEHRYELDAGYRCGVEHRRHVEDDRGEALRRAREEIVGTAASSFTLGTFAA